MESCPICGGTSFADFNGRPAAHCTGCGALERQRALAAAFADLLADGRGRSCLKAGPLNSRVYGQYLRERGWEYASPDRWRTGNPHDPRNVAFVDHELDLSDLSPLGERRFDLFLAQHVIEEIEDPGARARRDRAH